MRAADQKGSTVSRVSHTAAFTQDFTQEFEAQTASLLSRRFRWFTGIVGSVGAGLAVVALTIGLVMAVGPTTVASEDEGELRAPLDVAAEGSGADKAGEKIDVPNLPAADKGVDASEGPSSAVGGPVAESARPPRSASKEKTDRAREIMSEAIPHPFLGAVRGSAFALLSSAAYLGAFFFTKARKLHVHEILRFSFALVVFDGFLHILSVWLHMPVRLGMWGVMITHVVACSFLPWTVGQSLRPFVILFALQVVQVVLTGKNEAVGMIFKIVFSAFAGAPGAFVCWLRHSRRLEAYRVQFLQQRYGEVRRELVDARRIHESMFPKEITEGPVHLRYSYEPMRQIGGDYLFAWKEPTAEGGAGRFNLVLMDVTGHGIAAALTVNRLHGELQRVFAEDPEVHPGEVLRLLNRYVHLTLAQHSVFLTAICLRVDVRRDVLEYASGGHPPMYLRAVDGTIHQLAATSYVLGACADSQFDSHAQSVTFGPGDRLIAYTDGAIEARPPGGKMLGMSGFQRMVAAGQMDNAKSWPSSLLSAVETHRNCPPEDDTLVIEISRPVGVQEPSTMAVSKPTSPVQPGAGTARRVEVR